MDTSLYSNPSLNVYAQIAARTLILNVLASVIWRIESNLTIHRITENNESPNQVITPIGTDDLVTGYFVDTVTYSALDNPSFEKWVTEQLMIESGRLKTPFAHIDIMFTPSNIRLAIMLKEPIHKSLIKA